jgi:glycogen operon protein
MEDEHWDTAATGSLQVYLNGAGILVPDDRGQPLLDDSFIIIFHGHHEDTEFTLPDKRWGAAWECVLDTDRGFVDQPERFNAGSQITVLSRSLWVLRRVP